MIYKELEAIIKGTLSRYREDYNRINPNEKVDFSITLTRHSYDPIKDKNLKGDAKDKALKTGAMDVYYLRLWKGFEGNGTEVVIFAAYRPVDDFKKKADAYKSLFRECIDNLIIGGIEYAEALRMMNDKKQQEGQKSVTADKQ